MGDVGRQEDDPGPRVDKQVSRVARVHPQVHTVDQVLAGAVQQRVQGEKSVGTEVDRVLPVAGAKVD